MTKSKVRERVTRAAAADKLAELVEQLRSGSVSLDDKSSIAVTDEIELKIKLKNDEMEIELKWQPAGVAKRIGDSVTAAPSIEAPAEEANEQSVSLAFARANKFAIDWTNYLPPKPAFMGPRAFTSYDLGTLTPYIDWTPFFRTWELAGHYPEILEDKKFGAQAQKRFNDAQAMLTRIVAEEWLTANAVIGFWPANSIGDDIELYTGEPRHSKLATLHTLRQQTARDLTQDRAYTALADFIAPKEANLPDYIGGFAVTTGIGEEAALRAHIKSTNDDGRIMLKALAKRLAEAFAEAMHARVRREFWGYAKEERFSHEDLILKKYRGIRPAPGDLTQPDHTEKATLWKLMDVKRHTGIALTKTYDLLPDASVTGLYFAHPESHYFALGRLECDQVEDYAARKSWTIEQCERWLAPVLNYDPVASSSKVV
jgi:5-methyltetrahydrofolate--homocysteine methyltransferase